MIDELTQLAIKYGSDRQPGSKHSYTPYYHSLFKDKRGSIKKMLEIGVSKGSGLRMWRDYFSKAQIYGIDNDPAWIFTEDRIQTFICDQSSESNLYELIDKIGGDLDFVVDDASHRPQDQITSCLTLMPLLKPDTIYIIEDVADPTIISKLTRYNLEIPILERRKKRYDDLLIVVRHKNRIHPEFKEVINKRFSVRQFQPTAVDEGLLKEAVELAKLAPSAGNLQAYQVFITKEKIAYDAPVSFVICADPEKSAGRYGERGKSLYAIQDATIFASYLQLAIVNLGLASVWVGSFRESKIKSLLKIPDNLQVVALIPVGYPVGEKLGRRRRGFEEIVIWPPKE